VIPAGPPAAIRPPAGGSWDGYWNTPAAQTMPAERGTRRAAASTSISAASARPRPPRLRGDIGQHERQAAAIHPRDRRRGTAATFLVLAVIVITVVMTAAWWIT
jgi:hypothetical protein